MREHERLARLLTAEQRAWLARMADVLEPGEVVNGMAVPPGTAVYMAGDGSRPVIIHAPAGPSGTSGPTRHNSWRTCDCGAIVDTLDPSGHTCRRTGMERTRAQ